MDVNVLDFRAKGDGSSLDTEAFQSAIDQCHAFGGGTVHVPQGSYRIGTIELKSNVMLELAFGAVLLASENPKDYRKAYPA